MEHTIKIDGGRLSFVYSDDLADLLVDVGTATVARVSDVEPAPGGGWTADMTKAGAPGVLLGPFATRAAALDAERAWLADHRGL